MVSIFVVALLFTGLSVGDIKIRLAAFPDRNDEERQNYFVIKHLLL